MFGRKSIWAFFLLLLAYLFPYTLHSQTNTNIGGVVNVYRAVTEIIPSSCQIRVSDADSFDIGDKVLLIQMQGASINESNDANFGNISSIGNAGNYELNYICAKAGDTITLTLGLNNTYDVPGNVQLIKIPFYEDATVSSTLTAKAWDGTTGGVLAIDVSGTLTLNSNIDVSGKGFRGGAVQYLPEPWWGGGCNHTNYFYSNNDYRGAYKGEGLKITSGSLVAGKGKNSNGGGGGNHHNTGGGGGGNFGTGGNGGVKQGSNCNGTNPGIGGLSVSNTYKIFLGGGGGSGDDNNNQGSSGANGGGIILISANAIEANNNYIRSNGNNANFSLSDGAGGGGAGGTIFLDISNYGTTPINIEVRGGNGGNSSRWDTYCMGPGGGGGGGVLLMTSSSTPSNISLNTSGGLNGVVDVSTTAPCSLTTGGASPGTNGGLLLDVTLFQSPNTCAGCTIPLLPVTWKTFTAKAISKKVQLNWSVAMEENLDHYVVERSSNGADFIAIATVAPNSSKSYGFMDEDPHFGYNYYRIKNIDKDGSHGYSVVKKVHFQSLLQQINIIPNPVSEGTIKLELTALGEGSAVVFIFNSIGQVMKQLQIELKEGLNQQSIELNALPAGVYPVQVHTEDQVHQLKLVVQ